MKWVIRDQLARGCRPGRFGLRKIGIKPVVAAWCDKAHRAGIRSILCLLAAEQLEPYAELPGGLLDYYKRRGFVVEHVPAEDHKWPPLDSAQLDETWKLFCDLPKPVLVHCSAGIDRTGAAIKYIRARLRAEELPKS